MDGATDIRHVQSHLHDLISTAGHAGFQQLSLQALELNNALQSNQTEHIQQLRQSVTTSLVNALTYLNQEIEQLQAQLNADQST